MVSEEGRTASGRISKPRNVLRRDSLSVRTRASLFLTVAAIAAMLAIVVIPPDKTQATERNEGGACSDCHGGGTVESLLTVAGLPVGNYVPGQAYTVTITVVDNNGATGENSFDLILTGTGSLGTLTTSDPNAEINSVTEASANDGVADMDATSWTVTWTAPNTGDSVTISVWGVAGDGAGGSDEPVDEDVYSFTAIPEFSVLIIPVAGIVGAILVASRAAKRTQ